MVIAHVLSSFRVGGQERMALDLAAGQRARGHDVVAISLAAAADDGPLGAEFARRDVATEHLVKRGPTVDPTLPLRLAARLGRRHVSVVHAHNPQPLVYAAAAARAVGATLVQTRHGVAHWSRRQGWLVRQAARFADAEVLVSRSLADAVGRGPLRVIENGIDLERFRPDAAGRAEARQALGLAAGDLVVGTVSRLAPPKNVAGLVRAALPVLWRSPGRELLLVGDGPDAAAVRELVAAAGQGVRVRLLGARADIPQLLRAFDLFVLFSRTEGHPLAVLEAMASGLPVIATRVGGLPDLVEHGVTGLLVDPDVEAALGAAIGELLSEATRRAEMGRNGRARVLLHHSRDRMVDEYMALYAEVTAARRRRRWLSWS